MLQNKDIAKIQERKNFLKRLVCNFMNRKSHRRIFKGKTTVEAKTQTIPNLSS